MIAPDSADLALRIRAPMASREPWIVRRSRPRLARGINQRAVLTPDSPRHALARGWLDDAYRWRAELHPDQSTVDLPNPGAPGQ